MLRGSVTQLLTGSSQRVARRCGETDVAEYDAVHSTWERLSRDQHVGMSNAVAIVRAAANTDEGRRALSEILSDDSKVALVEADALSYLRISRDIPLPPGVEDQRIDAYFRENF